MSNRVCFEDTAMEKKCHGNDNMMVMVVLKMIIFTIIIIIIIIIIKTLLFCALSTRHGNHSPAALPPLKEFPVPVAQKVGWVSKTVRRRLVNREYFDA